MTTDPDPSSGFMHLAAPMTSTSRRHYAIACRSSAIVLEREGQPEAADALRAEAQLLERDISAPPAHGDAA